MRVEIVPVDDGKPYVVTLPMILIGSKPGCDFLVGGEGVPALCCVLALVDDLVLLRDLDTDSVRVNGQRVRRAVLLPSDRLSIASCEFTVQYERPPGTGTRPSHTCGPRCKAT
jgi:hypothetical protein